MARSVATLVKVPLHRLSPLFLLFMTCCVPDVVIDGEHYPHWVGSISRVRCSQLGSTLPDNTNLEVVVVDHWNQPLPSATVHIAGAFLGGQLRTLSTDQEGSVTVSMPPGGYAVLVTLGGFEETQTSVEIKEAESCVIKFSLGLDTTYRGLIR